MTIWGINPHGVARCYALNIPASDEKVMLEKAEKEGWTNLVVDRKPQPALFPDLDSSDSSEQPASRTTKRRRSNTSDGA